MTLTTATAGMGCTRSGTTPLLTCARNYLAVVCFWQSRKLTVLFEGCVAQYKFMRAKKNVMQFAGAGTKLTMTTLVTTTGVGT